MPLTPASRTRIVIAAAAVAVVLLGAVVALWSQDPTRARARASEDAAAAGGGRMGNPSPTGAPEPDRLPDPGVAPGECKLVTYTPPTAKQEQAGELCRPEANQRDVAVIVVHGGSGVSGSYHGMRPWASHYLAEGYVTFLPDYHLFEEGGSGPVHPWPEQNLKAAVQMLRGTGNALGISKDRIVLQGMSAGARIGAEVYTTPDDPWFAGPELWPGISDRVDGFIGFYHPYDGSMKYADQYYGGPDQSRDASVTERWAKANSIDLASRASGPALLVAGDKDWNVVVEQAQAFGEALNRSGHPCKVVVIEGGGHGFDQAGAEQLSKLGEQAATTVLTWINDAFPATPGRQPQTVPPDLLKAPNVTGEVPTTYQPRPQYRTPSTTWHAATSSTSTGATTASPSTTAGAPTSATSAIPTTVTTPAPTTTHAPTTTTVAPTLPPPTSSP